MTEIETEVDFLRSQPAVLIETHWVGENGHQHQGKRETCTGCGVVLSCMHNYCCGHAGSGFYTMARHECKGKK